MKSLLERSGRGAEGVASETGPVRPSLMIKALQAGLSHQSHASREQRGGS